MQKISRSWLAFASFVVMAAVSPTSHASLIAYICDDMLCTGGGDTIVTDQGVGDNFPGSASVGQINAGALNVGGFTIATNVAQRVGSLTAPHLNLGFSATTSDNQSHTIYLYASATDFTGAGTFAFQIGGNQPPAGTAESVTGRAYGGNTNTNLNLASVLSTLTTTATPYALSSTGAFVPTTSPYALTVGVAITRSAAGTSSGSFDLAILPNAVPEPESLLLLSIGLVALVGSRFRRARAT